MHKQGIAEVVKSFIKIFIATAIIAIMTFAVLVTTAQAANAEVTLKDVQTIVRTIGFLENSPTNSVMAIIYNPADTASVKDAHRIEDLIRKEKGGLMPRLVSVSSIGEIQNASFAFLTSGLQPHYKNIANTLRSGKILSFTLDRTCVDQNCCTIYINSDDRVKIVVNKTGADKVNAKFKPVFLMMVTLI